MDPGSGRAAEPSSRRIVLPPPGRGHAGSWGFAGATPAQPHAPGWDNSRARSCGTSSSSRWSELELSATRRSSLGKGVKTRGATQQKKEVSTQSWWGMDPTHGKAILTASSVIATSLDEKWGIFTKGAQNPPLGKGHGRAPADKGRLHTDHQCSALSGRAKPPGKTRGGPRGPFCRATRYGRHPLPIW